ncbi:hypothetical protein [Halobellus inordinatus]|nr:hypothetical protein [Halobellus ramosii]
MWDGRVARARDGGGPTVERQYEAANGDFGAFRDSRPTPAWL